MIDFDDTSHEVPPVPEEVEEPILLIGSEQIESFQQQIKDRMEDMCLTRAELGRRIGVTGGRIYRILDHPANVTASLCARLASALDCEFILEIKPKA